MASVFPTGLTKIQSLNFPRILIVSSDKDGEPDGVRNGVVGELAEDRELFNGEFKEELSCVNNEGPELKNIGEEVLLSLGL